MGCKTEKQHDELSEMVYPFEGLERNKVEVAIGNN